jgi:DNA-binding NarL/FixJ family response regulator
MSPFIKIVIVDDNRDIRENLAELIDGTENLKLVGAFENGKMALEEIPRLEPDVVIMDIEMPGMNGVECVRRLKAKLPRINFLVLTVYEDNDVLFESLKAGAGGYLLKRTSLTQLLQAIEELQAGGSPMTPQIARRVTQFFSSMRPAAKNPPAELEQLTPGQKKFLDELAQGYSYKEIADHLGITVHGVRNYIRKIYEKLHVHSRTEAINVYLNR